MTTPLMLAYGLGVDSTAVLVGLYKRRIRPDAILFANTGDEKKATYAYLPLINRWLESVGFPQVVVVRNVVKDFKHWPKYDGLGENCLTNGTLPSLAFGFKSCSLKWKVSPQNKWTDAWQPALDCWAAGGKVRKMIGYDASAKDMKRYAHAKGAEDPKYDYWYPLIEWGLDREGCKALIRSVGLPVPPKSACYFCPATQPAELHEHRKEYLRYIVIMEARAKPRLEGCMTQDELDADYDRRHRLWERITGKKTEEVTARYVGRVVDAALKEALATDLLRVVEAAEAKEPKRKTAGSGTAGLWRKATKKKPAMMTDYIREHALLTGDEIDTLIARAPKEIIDNQAKFANGEEFLDWHEFLEQFSPEDAVEELGCAGCNMTEQTI